jgi:GNAT superfamily N-acetyltransferase
MPASEKTRSPDICRAQPDDRHGICRVQKAAITILCGAHYTPEEVEAWVGPKQPDDYLQAIREEIVLVAKDGDAIVGFGQMAKGDSRISALYVDPNHLHGGIGSMLLNRLEQEARDLGSSVVRLEAPLNAVSFCLARGFSSQGEALRRVRSGVSVPCVQMEKRI